MKLTLIKKMEEAGSPAAWIREVSGLYLKIALLKSVNLEYALVIDKLAREREESDEYVAE